MYIENRIFIRCILIIAFLLALTAKDGVAQQATANVQSKYDLSFYGYVKMDASYDTQRTDAGNLMRFVLPEGADGRDDEFNLTANETRLGMRLNVPEMDGIQTYGVIESDFYGGGAQNSPSLRLRLAFADLQKGSWSLRAGQDWETFIVVMPRIVNFSFLADAGALGLRRPQLRLSYSTPLGAKTQLTAKLAAARTIGQDIDGRGQDDGAAAGFPSTQAALVLETDSWTTRKLMLGLSGHFGSEKVATYNTGDADEPITVPEKDYDSWSIIGTLVIPLCKEAMLQGAVWCGENLDNYFGGVGQGINKLQQAGIAAEGGWAQLVLNPTEKININLGYGPDNPDRDDLNTGDRTKNELFFGNLFYHLTDAVTLATEYSHLTTSYKGGDDSINNRVQGSVIFRF